MIIFKTSLKSLFNYFGFDVRRKLPPERPLGWHPDHLRDLGYHPKTIVDVGVGRGTPRLYKAFPNSYYVLVEPLHEFESDILNILENYNGCYVSAAVGNKEGTTTIHMLPGWKTMSSVRKPSKIHKDIYQSFYLKGITDAPYQERKRKVPLVTLDGILEKYSLQPPFGLKIDTEGFELEVVEGGGAHFLSNTEFVIAEVAIIQRVEGGYSFFDFVRAMDEHGFRICDILANGRLENPPELYVVDALFCRK
jgi:FkbM family methyltransferase